MNRLDKLIAAISPDAAVRRLQARMALNVMARHFEAAAPGRRTQNWKKPVGDANAVALPALGTLRNLARDLTRNNPWARRGQRVVANNTVGWGIVPKPAGSKRANARAREVWAKWALSTKCDYDGRLNFYGLERLVMSTVVEAGECIVRRRRRPASDRMTIPLQLQVLEPDFLDTLKDGTLTGGNFIVQGVEYSPQGKRVAYWLFREHPGATGYRAGRSLISDRVDVSEIIHVYRVDRPGQVRGPSWFAPVIVRLEDFGEYEDATLMRQKIAACFSVFVTDLNGGSTPTGDNTDDERIETLEPGMILYPPPGRDIKFAEPPSVSEFEPYSKTQLRAIAVGLGISYSQLSGDYSTFNFSSGRMERLETTQNLHDWRFDMLIPQFCSGAWAWAMEAAYIAGAVPDPETPAEWTPPALPMLEPDKEGLAYMRNVRAGLMTHDEMVREMGNDPETFWDEYGEGVKRLRELGIILDSDASMTTQQGGPREMGAKTAAPKPAGGSETDADEPPPAE